MWVWMVVSFYMWPCDVTSCPAVCNPALTWRLLELAPTHNEAIHYEWTHWLKPPCLAVFSMICLSGLSCFSILYRNIFTAVKMWGTCSKAPLLTAHTCNYGHEAQWWADLHVYRIVSGIKKKKKNLFTPFCFEATVHHIKGCASCVYAQEQQRGLRALSPLLSFAEGYATASNSEGNKIGSTEAPSSIIQRTLILAAAKMLPGHFILFFFHKGFQRNRLLNNGCRHKGCLSASFFFYWFYLDQTGSAPWMLNCVIKFVTRETALLEFWPT